MQFNMRKHRAKLLLGGGAPHTMAMPMTMPAIGAIIQDPRLYFISDSPSRDNNNIVASGLHCLAVDLLISGGILIDHVVLRAQSPGA